MGKWFRRAVMGLVAAAAVVVAAPFLVPVSHLIPEITRIASEELRQPVRMQDLRFHLFPTPRVVGHRISVGRKDEVMIGELEIVPELTSLFTGQRSIALIRASRVAIDERALVIPGRMPRTQPEKQLRVRRIILTTVRLTHSKLNLPVLDVYARLGPGLRLVDARVEAQDGSVKLRVEQGADAAVALRLQATNWTLPAGAPLIFRSLAARGTLTAQQLDVSHVEGELYGGKVFGRAQVEWGTELRVSGRAELAGVDLTPLQSALGKPAKLSGRLTTDTAFAARAKVSAELAETLTLEGPFEVHGGVYKGVDLSRATELGGGETAADDATVFHDLRGKLELRGQRVKLDPLCMRSPKMVASGHVGVAADKKLSGRLHLSLAQTGGLLGVPVTLGGTTEDVTMRPSKGYLIGAAIGTVLMPGLGTSLGSSLGGRIEGSTDCR